MDKNVPFFESIVNKDKGLFEMRSHFITGNIESVYYLVIDAMFFGVVYV